MQMKYLVIVKALGCVEKKKRKGSMNAISFYPKLRRGKVHNIKTFSYIKIVQAAYSLFLELKSVLSIVCIQDLQIFFNVYEGPERSKQSS